MFLESKIGEWSESGVKWSVTFYNWAESKNN